MSNISKIIGRKIMDSRGKPTVEVEIITENGISGVDSVPSGTSAGTKEAALVEVDEAIKNINEIIAPAITGMDVREQELIDRKMIELDGTENKARLGANAILGVSLALARTASLEEKMPLYLYLNRLFRKMSDLNIEPALPTPMMVMVCGGKHTESKVKLGIQEFLVMTSVENGILIWQALEKMLKTENITYTLGLEGAFAAEIDDNKMALDLINAAIKNTDGISADVQLGLDIAGSNYKMSDQDVLEIFQKYNLFSLEDPFSESSWEQFGQLKLELEELKRPFLLIGDDLFATHKTLLEKGINQIVANGIIIKPNQVGTLTETLEVMTMAHKAHFTCIVSHRSGETNDSFIADLAVGTGAKYIKSGAPIPKERLAKYNRLKEIALELNNI